MQEFIIYKNIKVYFSSSGKGTAIILLHGFLEDSSMWQNLIPLLSKKYRVITIDLLGHGKTNCLGYVHTMEDHANMIHAVLKHLKLRRHILIGHSMGGYIALAYAKLYTKNIKGLCLLNSTYEADDDEKKQLRTRANKIIHTDFDAMVRLSFSNLFSTESKIKHKEAYKASLKIALKNSLQGYIANQEGMKLREDYSSFFANASFKKLIILGKKDSVIDYKKTLKFSKKHQIPTQVFSEGHMSHIENERNFLLYLLRFIENI